MIHKIFFKYWRALLAISVFVFLSIMAFHDYDRFPYEGHLEEQSFAWEGFSLLKNNRPVSWSHFDYPKENKVFTGPIGE